MGASAGSAALPPYGPQGGEEPTHARSPLDRIGPFARTIQSSILSTSTGEPVAFEPFNRLGATALPILVDCDSGMLSG